MVCSSTDLLMCCQSFSTICWNFLFPLVTIGVLGKDKSSFSPRPLGADKISTNHTIAKKNSSIPDDPSLQESRGRQVTKGQSQWRPESISSAAVITIIVLFCLLGLVIFLVQYYVCKTLPRQGVADCYPGKLNSEYDWATDLCVCARLFLCIYMCDSVID